MTGVDSMYLFCTSVIEIIFAVSKHQEDGNWNCCRMFASTLHHYVNLENHQHFVLGVDSIISIYTELIIQRVLYIQKTLMFFVFYIFQRNFIIITLLLL